MISPVVDTDFLARHRHEVVLADVRWYLDGRSGRAAFERAHVPGAVFVDLDRWLAGDPGAGGGRHPLPDPAVFAEGMGRCGVGDGSLVVAYDDAGGVVAARLVWMLRAVGAPAAMLDGGLLGYDGPLESGWGDPAPASFTARAWPPERLADADDAAERANVVLDARPVERFRGDEEPLDARAGHIPGARSVPCRENLDPTGRLLPVEELRRRFLAAGADGTRPVVCYCGSGVTACHDLLVMEHCGLGLGRLYPGSWSQYASLAGRPVETGDPGSGPDGRAG